MIRIYIRKLNQGDDAHAVGRALLRDAVGEKRLIFGPHGKPYAADGSVFFNISHCQGAVGIAVGSRELGFDLEPKERTVKRKNFTLEKEEEIPPLTLWVLKESYAKWSGEGVSLIRGTHVTPLGENRYKGAYNGKEAVLQAFAYDGFLGAIACESIEEYEIKEM